MSRYAFIPVAWLVLAVMPQTAASVANLNGAKGHLHKVDLTARTFELLKETEYAPEGDLGQSRFTVHWDENTRVVELGERKDFTGVSGPVMALFQGLRPADRKALKAGGPFEARVVTLFSHRALAQAIEADDNQMLGSFSPSADKLRCGVVEVGGRSLEVALRSRHWRIFTRELRDPTVFAKGFWSVDLEGRMDGGRFVASELSISRLPDPRMTDDPKLPRVLVIGDSISMNYHDVAKEALAGVANYHRCEGNAFTSGHGLRNAELWMGEHQQPGLHWDVIHFNHGLHDLKQSYDKATGAFGPYAVSVDDYKANLEKMIAVLRKSGARLIWCSTTPVPNDNKGTYARRKGAAKEFNQAALAVMRQYPDILINDLHGLIDRSPDFDSWRNGSDVHFYREEERQVIGRAVADAVGKALTTQKEVKANPPG